jgi:hypothetical protein
MAVLTDGAEGSLGKKAFVDAHRAMCAAGLCCLREGRPRPRLAHREAIAKVIAKDYVVRGSYTHKEDGSERLRGEEEVRCASLGNW